MKQHGFLLSNFAGLVDTRDIPVSQLAWVVSGILLSPGGNPDDSPVFPEGTVLVNHWQ